MRLAVAVKDDEGSRRSNQREAAAASRGTRSETRASRSPSRGHSPRTQLLSRSSSTRSSASRDVASSSASDQTSKPAAPPSRSRFSLSASRASALEIASGRFDFRKMRSHAVSFGAGAAASWATGATPASSPDSPSAPAASGAGVGEVSSYFKACEGAFVEVSI